MIKFNQYNNQYIHPEVIKSCQLDIGLIQLEPGSNWNTLKQKN